MKRRDFLAVALGTAAYAAFPNKMLSAARPMSGEDAHDRASAFILGQGLTGLSKLKGSYWDSKGTIVGQSPVYMAFKCSYFSEVRFRVMITGVVKDASGMTVFSENNDVLVEEHFSPDSMASISAQFPLVNGDTFSFTYRAALKNNDGSPIQTKDTDPIGGVYFKDVDGKVHLAHCPYSEVPRPYQFRWGQPLNSYQGPLGRIKQP